MTCKAKGQDGQLIKSGATKAKLGLVFSMVVFGSIGVFRSYIDLPSGVIAMVRGFVGMLTMLLYILLTKKKISWAAIRANLLKLVLSGAFIGFNWMLLFEAFRFTSVATATLCYYMAPVIVTVASVFVLKEKLSIKKLCCVAAAIAGMVLVSGVFTSESTGSNQTRGVLLALAAAVLYAFVTLINKKLTDVAVYDRTFMQLGIAALAILPYNLITTDISQITFDKTSVLLLLLVGVLHTGFTYVLYFGSMDSLKAQTVAIISYIDPTVAVACSALILRESIDKTCWIGAALILCSTIVSEWKEQ